MIAGLGLLWWQSERGRRPSACPPRRLLGCWASLPGTTTSEPCCTMVDPAAGAAKQGRAIASGRSGTGTIPSVRDVLQADAARHTLLGNAAAQLCYTSSASSPPRQSSRAAAGPRIRQSAGADPAGLLSKRAAACPCCRCSPSGCCLGFPRDRRPWWAASASGLDAYPTASMLPLGALMRGPWPARIDTPSCLRAGPSTARAEPPLVTGSSSNGLRLGIARAYLGRDVTCVGVFIMPCGDGG